MELTSITMFLTTVLALSMAVERVVEIIKGMFPDTIAHAKEGNAEFQRCAWIRLMSATIGSGIAYISHLKLFEHDCPDLWPRIGCALLLGFLSAGGSAFWNHLLDIVKASKIKDEVDAKKTANIPTIA